MSALSIDTAANICAVAITDRKTGETLASQSLDISRGHAEVLMPMIETCLKQSGLTVSHISLVICTCGPGSFTGVRVGLSTARAIALGLSVPIIGISNLQACALYAAEISDSKTPILVLLDARRDQVYVQMFISGKPMDEARICQIDTVYNDLNLSEHEDIHYCGSGVSLFFERREKSGSKARNLIHDRATSPIGIIAKLGISAPIPDAPPEPIYLRSADAKKQQGFAVQRIVPIDSQSLKANL